VATGKTFHSILKECHHSAWILCRKKKEAQQSQSTEKTRQPLPTVPAMVVPVESFVQQNMESDKCGNI